MVAARDYERRWWTLAVLCLSLVMIVVANASLNVALPTLVRDLNAGSSSLQWIVDAYSLVFAGLLLTAGALGDRYGRRLALNGGLILFGIASGFAAFSSSANALIVARAFMGVGAAFVMPATLSVLAHVFPPDERPKAIAIWAAFAGVGAGLGGVTSGWLLQHFWWGSIFLTNVFVVAIALIAGFFLVPSANEKRRAPLDPLGALLSIAGLGTLIYGIIEAPNRGWLSPCDGRDVRAHRRDPRCVRGVGVPRHGPDARPAVLPQPALHRRRDDDHARVLRDVRDVLRHHAVPAARPRLLAARSRHSGAPVGRGVHGVDDAFGRPGQLVSASGAWSARAWRSSRSGSWCCPAAPWAATTRSSRSA